MVGERKSWMHGVLSNKGFPIQMTAEEVEVEIKNEYGNKLIIDGITIGNPFDIKEGWLEEAEGIVYLPMLFILTFSTTCVFTQVSFHQKICQTIKTAKPTAIT